MTTIEDIRQAVDANANDSRSTYWSACETLARDGATDKQRDVALRKAAKAAHDIGADAEQIDADVQLLRERNALPDLEAMKRDSETESRQLVDEAGSLEAKSAAASACAKIQAEEAGAKRRMAGASRTAVNTARQHAQKIQRSLAQRGYPAALVEAEAERQQQARRQATADVAKAEQELAESIATHEAAKADPLRRTHGPDPIANYIQRRQREVDLAQRKLAEIEAKVEREPQEADVQ